MRDMAPVPSRDGDVVLGDDWVAPGATSPSEMRARRERRGLFFLRAWPITWKIVTINLVALCLLIAGISYLNSSRDSLAGQRAAALVSEAELIADIIEVQLPTGVPVNLATGDGVDIDATLDGLNLRNGTEVFVFDPSETLIANTSGTIDVMGASEDIAPSSTVLTDGLNWLWSIISSPFAANSTDELLSVEEQMKSLVSASLVQGTQLQNALDADGLSWFGVITPIKQGTESVGVVAVISAAGEIDTLVRSENENMLQMFIIATLVSIGLNLALAATIANPLSDLAAAAELGRDKNSLKVNPGRIRIPDLTARQDELGRLSGALRGMISTLYNRIDGNEQFAADVAHEIKNPLTPIQLSAERVQNKIIDKLNETDKELLNKSTNTIIKQVDALKLMVNEFAEYSRTPSLVRKIINITELIDEISYLYSDQRIEIQKNYPNIIKEIKIDENKFRQVLINIFDKC